MYPLYAGNGLCTSHSGAGDVKRTLVSVAGRGSEGGRAGAGVGVGVGAIRHI